MTELLSNYLPIVIFIALSALIGGALLVAPFLVAVKRPDPEKVSAFEAGFTSAALTDPGEDADYLHQAAEIAAGKGVSIITIGVGDPDASGEDRVDLATLEDIAGRTGGAYFFAADEAALAAVYERIDELAPREVETLSYRPREALSYIPLLLAALVGTLTLGGLSVGARHRRAQA